jgi:hypothetical protein
MWGAHGGSLLPPCLKVEVPGSSPGSPTVAPTTDIADGPFHEGQPVWVIQADGSQRAGEYVGGAETSAWFGGAPTVFVAYPDTRSGEAVEVDRVIPREG